MIESSIRSGNTVILVNGIITNPGKSQQIKMEKLTTWQKWKYRIIGALVAAAVIWFLIFVAFPIVAVGVIAAAIAYMLYNFFS